MNDFSSTSPFESADSPFESAGVPYASSGPFETSRTFEASSPFETSGTFETSGAFEPAISRYDSTAQYGFGDYAFESANSELESTDPEYEYVYEYVEVDEAGEAEAAQAELPVAVRPSVVEHPIKWFTWFRRTRPFWGVIVLAYGAYFVAEPLFGNNFTFYAAIGSRAITPLLLGAGMGLAAILSLIMPKQRYFPAIMAALLSVAALPMANLGGFVLGTLCGIVGSGLIFAWTPYSDKQVRESVERVQAKAERKTARRHAEMPGAA
jgi:hypothetical protein